jgi:hypothetical protein
VPGDHLAGRLSESARQPLAGPDPECVAVEIIDVFEVVKVYQEERMLAAVGRRRSGRRRQRAEQRTTVR